MKNLLVSCSILAGLSLATLQSYGHPYASGVTNNNGTIQFILNEPADNVYVVFNDGTTNVLGQQTNSGLKTFALGTHTNFQIYVTKLGNGTPFQTSSDTNPYNNWNSPRGVAVNGNPTNGYLFGRVYVDNSAVGGSGANLKGKGIYMLNADQTDSPQGRGTNAYPSGFWNASTSSPYRMSVAPDNSLIVGDYSTAAATVWQFDGDFLHTTNQMLAVIGENQGIAAGIHSDIHGHPIVTGSLASSNLVLWTSDEALPSVGSNSLGFNTAPGNVDDVFRYNMGSGPLPWSNAPNFALAIWPGIGIADLGQTDVAIHRQTGNIYAMLERGNYGNPNLQVFDPTGTQQLFSSLQGPVNVGPDPLLLSYSIDISPDGLFVAVANVNNAIYVMQITNGVPDISTLITIPNTPTTGNNRGIGFDAADNIYAVSSGQGLMRVFSLGLSTVAVTGNDATGTNGTFQLVLPTIRASVVATTNVASQNYGKPIPGVFTISLNTNFLSAPVVVNYIISGTATNGTFTIVSTNSITFLPGTNASGNFSTNITVTPTAVPVSGPTFNVTLTLVGGANYLTAHPITDTINIVNTGPDVISITPAAGSTMYRGVANDYATFVISRLGDTNGPAPSHSPSTLTVTNFIYGGQAVFGVDYLAGVQPIPTALNSSPANGNPGIVFNPGDVSKVVVVGNPVRSPFGAPVGNKTISIYLGPTNGAQAFSQEGYAYSVASTAPVNLTEIDNAYPPEVVLYSNSLASASDSTNWTVTFAWSNNPANPVLPPVVISNYVDNYYGGYNGPGMTLTNGILGNSPSSSYATDGANNLGANTNDFDVEFGYQVSQDGIGQSPDMAANHWNTALKMTVNKDQNTFGEPAGVNTLLQGKKFAGNYAVRFTANLSEGNYFTPEFAMFGMNQYGTNCDWRVLGSSTYTNHDGQYFTISTGPGGSITPADYDMLSGGTGSAATSVFAFPNGGDAEPVSDPSTAFVNVFKHPPYTGDPLNSTQAGMPSDGALEGANTWCDVELRQVYALDANNNPYITNQLSINHTFIFGYTNTGVFTNGTVMLGYEDPIANIGDTEFGGWAAAYYSNLRVVETAPTIFGQPTNFTAASGTAATFTATGIGTAPFTNVWYYQAATNSAAVVVSSNVVSTASNTATLTLSGVASTNSGSYYVVVTDAAGSATSRTATLTVNVSPVITSAPVSLTNGAGATVSFTVGATGNPLAYQWSFSAVGATNSSLIAGATSSTLTLTNIQVTSSGTYSVVVSNLLGTASGSATLTVTNPPAVPPTILTQPTNVTVTAGGTGTFTVTAAGIQPYTNVWFFSATNTNYVAIKTNLVAAYNDTNSLAVTNPGSYYVVVSDTFGATTSQVATLTSISGPTITQPLVNMTNAIGSNVTFVVGAAGAGLNYVWSFVQTGTTNVVILTNALTSSLTLSNIQVTSAGTYTVLVSNSVGSASSSGTLTVTNNPPIITTQPINVTVASGSNGTFTVVASGFPSFTNIWFYSATNTNYAALVTNVVSAASDTNSITAANAGNYYVVVSDPGGSVTSSIVTLSVTNAVVTQPPSFVNGGSAVSNGVVTLKFTTPNAGDTTNSYNLQSSSVVVGPYTNNPAAIFATNAAGFTVTVPTNGATEFYRLQHK
jgi:hypothetical protein